MYVAFFITIWSITILIGGSKMDLTVVLTARGDFGFFLLWSNPFNEFWNTVKYHN